MTAPRFAECRCGHPHSNHEALAPQCAADHCTCLTYRPTTVPVITHPAPFRAAPPPTTLATLTMPATVAPNGPTAEQLLAAGRRSDAKRTAALAAKIDGLLGDLVGRLRDERAGSQVRREIAELEAKLAQAKAKQAKLRGDTPARATSAPASGDHACPDCPRTFSTAQSTGVHRARAHGYRKASAS